MNELERARFDLEMILPYVASLREKIVREEERVGQVYVERRKVAGSIDDRAILASGKQREVVAVKPG